MNSSVTQILRAFGLASAFAGLLLATDAAHAWSPPANVTTPDPSIGAPAIAVNPAGQQLVAWNFGAAVQARVRTGGTWSVVSDFDPGGQGSRLAGVSEGPGGTGLILLSTTPRVGTVAQVETAFYSGGAWTVPAPIPATPGTQTIAARAAFDAQDQATLVWVERSGANCTIQSSVGTAQTGWGLPQVVGAGCFDHLQLAVNPRGAAVAAFGATPAPRPGSRAGSPAFVASRRGGGWSALVDLDAQGSPGPYQTAPSVALAANGVALAVYSDASLGLKWSRMSAADGSWSAVAVLDGSVPAVPHAVAFSGAGDAVAVYASYYNGLGMPAPLLAARLSRGGNRWSAAQTLTAPGGDVNAFSLAGGRSGAFVAGWVDELPDPATAPPGATAVLGASLLLPGAAQWTTTTLDADESDVSPTAAFVAVGIDRGHAVASWNAGRAKADLSVQERLRIASTPVR